MLRFIEKKEVWDAVENGIESFLSEAPFSSWQLKSAQDIVAMSLLKDSINLSIAEIGGGASRLLPHLTKQNTVFNIDPSEGADNGPLAPVKQSGVENILCNIGASSEQIKDGSFDKIFSISVVEHIPNEDIDTFFQDCHRILKNGGEMIHLIDIYVGNDEYFQNGFFKKRFDAYDRQISKAGSESGLFVSAIQADTSNATKERYAFKTQYITNPDPVMYAWRTIAPNLHEVREKSQLCTLLMHVKRRE